MHNNWWWCPSFMCCFIPYALGGSLLEYHSSLLYYTWYCGIYIRLNPCIWFHLIQALIFYEMNIRKLQVCVMSCRALDSCSYSCSFSSCEEGKLTINVVLVSFQRGVSTVLFTSILCLLLFNTRWSQQYIAPIIALNVIHCTVLYCTADNHVDE